MGVYTESGPGDEMAECPDWTKSYNNRSGYQHKGRGSLQFFLYDVIKITVLLCVLIIGISYIQSYFPPGRSRRIMGRFHGIGANVAGALLPGLLTPFCSCSSDSDLHGFYERRASSGRDFFFPDLITDGGPWKSGPTDEYFRGKGRCRLCDTGTHDCGDRRHTDRKAPYGGPDCRSLSGIIREA